MMMIIMGEYAFKLRTAWRVNPLENITFKEQNTGKTGVPGGDFPHTGDTLEMTGNRLWNFQTTAGVQKPCKALNWAPPARSWMSCDIHFKWDGLHRATLIWIARNLLAGVIRGASADVCVCVCVSGIIGGKSWAVGFNMSTCLPVQALVSWWGWRCESTTRKFSTSCF